VFRRCWRHHSLLRSACPLSALHNRCVPKGPDERLSVSASTENHSNTPSTSNNQQSPRRFRKKHGGKRPFQKRRGPAAGGPARGPRHPEHNAPEHNAPEHAAPEHDVPVSHDAPIRADGFAHLELAECLLRSLGEEGYSTPTPIQEKAVPQILSGRDLFGCAQTGTGKTAAFALPLIHRLLENRPETKPRRCRTLVLAPTRELAAQIHESFRTYGRHARLRSAVIYGGVGQHQQARAMMRGVDVLVATPGRLLDLIGQRLVDIRAVEFFVLDEADRMLDMGFIHDLRKIVDMLPEERQTLFFSATLPAEVRSFASTMLRDPLEVKTAPQATPAETVEQSVIFVPKREKKSLLIDLLRDEAKGRVIVFSRTKHGADKLQRDLAKSGVAAAAIHGDKSQAQRERALAAFKSTRPPVLVATDIAARGIDVDDVAYVINYDLPIEPETYVHRIGRSGRAGQSGTAISLCDIEEVSRLIAIERLLKKELTSRNERPEEASQPQRRPGRAGRGGQGRPGGQGKRRGPPPHAFSRSKKSRRRPAEPNPHRWAKSRPAGDSGTA
jgi:ATP-dependent RNA helicase RhlE